MYPVLLPSYFLSLCNVLTFPRNLCTQLNNIYFAIYYCLLYSFRDILYLYSLIYRSSSKSPCVESGKKNRAIITGIYYPVKRCSFVTLCMEKLSIGVLAKLPECDSINAQQHVIIQQLVREGLIYSFLVWCIALITYYRLVVQKS